MNTPLYTVRLGSATGKMYGRTHGSMDSNATLCGKDINDKWWIINNTFDGGVTCLECLKQLCKEENNVS